MLDWWWWVILFVVSVVMTGIIGARLEFGKYYDNIYRNIRFEEGVELTEHGSSYAYVKLQNNEDKDLVDLSASLEEVISPDGRDVTHEFVTVSHQLQWPDFLDGHPVTIRGGGERARLDIARTDPEGRFAFCLRDEKEVPLWIYRTRIVIRGKTDKGAPINPIILCGLVSETKGYYPTDVRLYVRKAGREEDIPTSSESQQFRVVQFEQRPCDVTDFEPVPKRVRYTNWIWGGPSS